MGVTDSNGRLMIPGLLPYQANRISIDSRDLPMTVQVIDTGESVAPYYPLGYAGGVRCQGYPGRIATRPVARRDAGARGIPGAD